jgi:2-haloalkanoic acid dehalogenase type II
VTDRWVSLDCYGTLVDFAPSLTDAFARLWPDADPERLASLYLRSCNAAERGETHRSYPRIVANALRATAALEELPERAEAADVVIDAMRAASVYPEVPEIVAELGRRGWGIGVLTNVGASVVRSVLDAAEVSIDVLVTFEESGTYKPDPGHWRRFAELSGAQPGRHVHVGAWLGGDILPATRLGLPCVWVNRYRETSPLPRSAELPTLAGLPDVLDALVPAPTREPVPPI